MANALFVADLARLHAGEDWYGLPQLRRTAYFPLYGSILGEYVLNFGDTAHGRLLAAPTLRLAAEYRDPVLQWYAEQGSTDDVLSLLWWDPELESSPPSGLEISVAYPGGVEWAVLRSSLTDPDAVVVGLRGGTTTASHCHRDLQSIIVHALGEPLIADHGNLGYSRDYWVSQYGHLGRDTRAHNTLLPEGLEQVQRRTIPTMVEGEDLRCSSRIIVLVRQADSDYVASEAVLTYGEGDGGRRVMVCHDRHMALVRPGLLLLVDEVSCGEPLELGWSFHAGGDVELRGDGACFRSGVARLDFRAHGGARLSLTRRDDQKLPYLFLESAARVSKALFVATLLPYRVGEEPAAPEVTVRGKDVELSWRGSRHRLRVASRRWE